MTCQVVLCKVRAVHQTHPSSGSSTALTLCASIRGGTIETMFRSSSLTFGPPAVGSGAEALPYFFASGGVAAAGTASSLKMQRTCGDASESTASQLARSSGDLGLCAARLEPTQCHAHAFGMSVRIYTCTAMTYKVEAVLVEDRTVKLCAARLDGEPVRC